jgi:hypothetical protein
MKTILKTGMIAVGLFLISIAVALVLLAKPAGGYGKSYLEQQLGHVFGTDAHIEKIQVIPVKRGIELRGVSLDNPPEFKAGSAITLESVFVRPDLRTLFSPIIRIQEIRIANTEAKLQFNPGEGTNLGQLSRHAADLAAAAQNPENKSPVSRKLQIDTLTCNGAKITVRSIATAGIPVDFRVEPFTLKNLGDGDAVSFAKASSITLRSLLMETITINGLLRPVVDLLRGETEQI